MNKKEKARIICKFLKKKYSKHLLDIKNWHENAFQLLIATILSQRTRDENTEKASKQLFKVARTPKAILKLKNKKLQELIKPSGFYRQKAKNIKKVCKILLEKHKGKVPSSRAKLLELPGVGYKTSSVILCYGFGKKTIPIDTHVAVCSRRLGLTKHKEPEKIRKDLETIVPENCKRIINLGFVNFGKEVCLTRKPRCDICELKKICDYHKNVISERKK